MNTNELKELADLYFDNELEKNKEALLFSCLASDEEAREYFFTLNVIRNTVEKDMQPFPASLEERIFNSFKEKDKKRGMFFSRSQPLLWVATGIAVLFITVNIFLFTEIGNYKYQVKSISEQINMQNRTIDLILNNTLPPAEVKGRSINEVIVRANL